jgi:hypothetical protein
MARRWSDDVVVLSEGPSRLDLEQSRRLKAAGVCVDERRLVELVGQAGQLEKLVFAGGSPVWNAMDSW